MALGSNIGTVASAIPRPVNQAVTNPMISPVGGVLGQYMGGGAVNPPPQGGGPAPAPEGGGGGMPGQEGFDINSFVTDNPMYKFLQTEGLRGMQRTAAAKGMFGSGNLLRDLTSFSSGLASQSYNTEMDRIMKMAGVGAGSPAAAGQSYTGARGEGTGYQQEGFGSLGGVFNMFQ